MKTPEKSKKRKRVSEKDREYRPYFDPKLKRRNVSQLLGLMDARSDTPTKTVLYSDIPADFTFSTPENGALSRNVYTPGMSVLKPMRLFKTNDGNDALFISENKAIENTLTIPEPNEWIQSHSPVPVASLDGYQNVKMTLNNIHWVKGQKRNPDQKTLMQGSAEEILKNAGFELPSHVQPQHLHLIPFSFKGNKYQKVDNLGIGTHYGNAAMELINTEIHNILLDSSKNNSSQALYLDAIPEWVKGFESIRLLKSVTLIVKSQPKDIDNTFPYVKVTFNTLSTSPISQSEIKHFESLMRKKFLSPQNSNIENSNIENIEPPQKRSKRTIKAPNRYTG